MDIKILTYIKLVFSVLAFSVISAGAQVRVSGIIVESNGQPVPYASIQFIDPTDSTFAGGTLTETDGEFLIQLKNGNYRFRISSLGFKPLDSGIFIPAGETEFRLDTMVLAEVIKNLDAIIVRARKPLYEKQSDRINIHVGGITGAGSTVLGILSKSPGVLVNRQNGNIEVNGKKGILLMIDGKANRLPPDALLQMLDGMNSENVEKIEIITSPPARFEASGDAGIINIIMKSNKANGLNGNISVTSGYQRGPIYGSNIRIYQKENKLNTFLNYSFRSVQTVNYWEFDSEFILNDLTVTDHNESKRKPLTRLHDLKTGFEYQFTGKTRASLLLSGYSRNWDMKAVTTNRFGSELESVGESYMAVSEINKWQSFTTNMELTQKLGNNHTFSLAFDYLYYMNNNPSSYSAQSDENFQVVPVQPLMEVKKRTPIYYKVGSLDYRYQPNSKISIEAGMKGAFSAFHNKVSVIKYNNESSPAKNNSADANLSEKILGFYYSTVWELQSKLHVQAGLRYEHTLSKFSRDIMPSVNLNFGTFFPSLALTYAINQERKVQISFNRRITRPTFNDMAPFVFYIGPRTYVSGNLELKPSVTDALDLSWNIRKLWLSLKYANSKNEIAQFQPERDTITNEIVLRAKNMDYLRVLSFQAVLPLKLIRWWTIQNDFSVSYYVLSTMKKKIHINETLKAISFKMVHSLDLSEMLKAEADFSYQSGSFSGISRYKSSGFVNLGIKKEFKNGSVLSLMANDLFNTTQWRIETYSEKLDYVSEWSYDWGGRSVTLSFNFHFGNKSLSDPEIKPRSDAERNRVN